MPQIFCLLIAIDQVNDIDIMVPTERQLSGSTPETQRKYIRKEGFLLGQNNDRVGQKA